MKNSEKILRLKNRIEQIEKESRILSLIITNSLSEFQLRVEEIHSEISCLLEEEREE